MKNRARMDLSFNDHNDAASLYAYAKNISAKATNINNGEINEEKSFVDTHICRHDEGLPCTLIDRSEVTNKDVKHDSI